MTTTTTKSSQAKNPPLIWKPLIDTDKLPENIKNRVNALRYYQHEHEKFEAEFQEEVLKLEKRFLKEKYAPLYKKRTDIIQGKVEPPQDDVEAGVKIDEEEKKRLGEEPEEGEEKMKTATVEEDNSEEGRGPVKGIPEFWLIAMKQLVPLGETITERDEEALKCLIDIRMEYIEKSGFKLIFEFEENPFFTNKILEKTYFYQEEPGYGGDFVYDYAEGTQINWKEGRNLTKAKDTGDAESFFSFFNPPVVHENEEDAQLDDHLEMDYQIGEDIKEKLIPRAIDWYTGRALKYDEDYNDLFYEEDTDDEDELDDDNERANKKIQRNH